MKTCRDCKEEKPFTDFHPRCKSRYEKYKDSIAGYEVSCKVCNNTRRREFYEGNADKVKHQDRNCRLKATYGIDVDDYNKMFKEQTGCCKICGDTPNKQNSKNKRDQRLAIDHCHTTGKVRGLLCVKCNLGLGYARDDEKILKSMIDYLKDSVTHKDM